MSDRQLVTIREFLRMVADGYEATSGNDPAMEWHPEDALYQATMFANGLAIGLSHHDTPQ